MKLLNITHPSTTQKQVLATIISAATPQLADEYTNKTPNMIAAKQMLMKLGLIDFNNRGVELTDIGWQIAAEEGIVSQPYNKLTPLGQQLAGGNADNGQASINQPPNSPDFPVDDSPIPINSELDSAGQPSVDDMANAPAGGMIRPGVGANVANIN